MSRTRAAWGWRLAAAVIAAVSLATLASVASAVVLRTPTGQLIGVALHRGVNVASLPGSVAAHAQSGGGRSGPSPNMVYGGGLVVHSSAPYLVFWTPPGQSISAGSRSLLTQYLTDVTTDSGKSTNVYGALRQYYDASGFADYQQSFSGSQVITDTQHFPGRDTTNCPDVTTSWPICLTDSQLESELARLITADSLPTDGPVGSSALPADAPIYMVVLPNDVNVCQPNVNCVDNAICSYHSSFADNGNEVLYAIMPMLPSRWFPKTCQDDGNAAVQEPNGDPADVVLKYLSHENSETITDPFVNNQTAWVSSSGLEVGDNCNQWSAQPNPNHQSMPDAFTPALGGSAASGTLYNQAIGAHRYYLQSEWSNGDANCELRPTRGTITPQFTVPSPPNPAGSTLTFDPSASTSTNSLSSATWSFGDGSSTVFRTRTQLGAVSHQYSSPGNYTVTLTLVDGRGNLVQLSHPVTIGQFPVPAFGFSPTQPVNGSAVSFDATASSDPDAGVSITSYSWDFGDSTSGTGVTPGHVYSAAGRYTVTLTTTNSLGLHAAVSHVLDVFAAPVARFTATPSQPTVGQSVQLDGSASTDPHWGITTYAWNYGDGNTASGPSSTAAHAYQTAGDYTVTLTITDSAGHTAFSSQQLIAGSPPSVSFTVSTENRVSGAPVSFDGSASTDSDPGVTLTTYTWNFGDGSAPVSSRSPTVSHTFAQAGTFSVQLTVANSIGLSSSLTQQVPVAPAPVASFTSAPANPLVGQTISLDGSRSTAPPPATLTNYAWDFGNGSSSPTNRSATISHAYQTAGDYNVTLTVTDSNGHTASTTEQLIVGSPPSANFSYPTNPRPVQGTPVPFDGTASTDSDPGVTIVTYAWTFGDGGTATGSSPTISHTYSHPGTYQVQLTVTNSIGLSDALTESITLDALPLPAFTSAPHVPIPGKSIAFDGSGSTDPNQGVTIVGYSWSFGDGTSPVTSAVPGTAHAYSSPGSYTVTLTVTDSLGHSASTTSPVRVYVLPTASFLPRPAGPVQDAPVVLDASGSADANPGAVLTRYDWTFGDGTTQVTQVPQARHVYARPGMFTVKLIVTDSLGLTGSVAARIAVAPAPPTAALKILPSHPAAGSPVSFDGSLSTDPNGPIVSYAWSFGDQSSSATGLHARHTYRKPGTYKVVLVVTDAAGRQARATHRVWVAAPGRILHAVLQLRPSGAVLAVVVSAPGVVIAHHKRIRAHRAGTVHLRFALTKTQARDLRGRLPFTVRLRVRFIPLAGPPVSKLIVQST